MNNKVSYAAVSRGKNGDHGATSYPLRSKWSLSKLFSESYYGSSDENLLLPGYDDGFVTESDGTIRHWCKDCRQTDSDTSNRLGDNCQCIWDTEVRIRKAKPYKSPYRYPDYSTPREIEHRGCYNAYYDYGDYCDYRDYCWAW